MNPNLVRLGTSLLSETYTTALTTIGTFDTTHAASNVVLFLLVEYSRPSATNDNYQLTNVTYNGVAATFVSKIHNIANSREQPRIALYTVTNPTQLAAAAIAVQFDIDLTDNYSQISVLPMLWSNVDQTTPVGYRNAADINPYIDQVLFDDIWDIQVPAQRSNSTVIAAVLGSISVRNGWIPRGNTVELAKGTINFPTSVDMTHWLGKLDVSYNGLSLVQFSQTVYPNTSAVLVFEIRSADPSVDISAPYAISSGSSPVVTFSGLSGAVPSTITLKTGALTQSIPVIDTLGTYTLEMPDLIDNKVLFGTAELTFVDGGYTILHKFEYNALPLLTRTLTSVSTTAYESWPTKPVIGDQLIYDNLLTNVTEAGDLEPYSDGTFTYHWLSVADAATTAFTATFGETVTGTIEDVGTTVTLTIGSTAFIKIASGYTAPPAWVSIEEIGGEKIEPQLTSTFDVGNSTIDYTVFMPFYNPAKSYRLLVGGEDGWTATKTVTFNTIAPLAMSLTGFVANSTSPKYDSDYQGGNRA